MAKLTKQDVQEIRETILRTGEFRVHLVFGRGGANGNTCTARLWHVDGHKVGRATGGGYDMRGSALGDAIELFFQPELATISTLEASRFGIRPSADNSRNTVDGACGLGTMLLLLDALGFKARSVETGKNSTMILAEKASS